MHRIRNYRRRQALGKQLWECRFKRQWTLAQTSALIDGRLSPERIERMEIGKHRFNDIHVIAPLCELYGKDYVITLVDLPKPYEPKDKKEKKGSPAKQESSGAAKVQEAALPVCQERAA